MNIPAKPPQGDAACINKAGLCFCWNSLHQFPHTVLSQGWKLCFAGCCQHRRAMYTHASKLYDDRGTASGGSLVFKLPIVHFYPHPKNHFFPNNFPWYYQSSKYYIWHYSQSPKNIITDQSKASMLPIKKKSTIKESMFWKACPIREFHFWFVSRPDTLYRYHQLWIKNAPLPFTRITFGLLSPEQVIKQTRQRLRFKLVHIRHFHSITNTHSKKKSAV